LREGAAAQHNLREGPVTRKKPRSATSKRSAPHLKDLKPAPVTGAEAKSVKGGQELPPDKRRQIARDT